MEKSLLLITKDIIESNNIDLGLQDLGIKSTLKPLFKYLKAAQNMHNTYIMTTPEPAGTSLAIIVSKALNVDSKVVESSKARLMTLILNKLNLAIINIYISPHKEALRREQIKEMEKTIMKHQKEGKEVILLGDMNSMEDSDLDRWFNTRIEKARADIDFFQIIKKTHMVNTFRYLHPHKRKFTRIGKQKINKTTRLIDSRIDLILVSKELTNVIKEVKIWEDPIIDTDHRLVTLLTDIPNRVVKLNRNEAKKRRKDFSELKNSEKVELYKKNLQEQVLK